MGVNAIERVHGAPSRPHRFLQLSISAKRACHFAHYYTFLKTRPCSSQLTTFDIMKIVNNSVNDVSNFVIKRPRDSCEVSN